MKIKFMLFTIISLPYFCLAGECKTNICIIDNVTESYKNEDDRLNIEYKKVREFLPDEKFLKVKEVQKLWIKYRDEKCSDTTYKASDTGEESKIDRVLCLSHMSSARSIELRMIYDSDFRNSINYVYSSFLRTGFDWKQRNKTTLENEYIDNNCRSLDSVIEGFDKEFCKERMSTP
ncbi:lysozyme inhibitor LprI family protein [Pokkaliibacter plantistimulans]|uniref:lysozyme inhibitor LprI family protein n=1 Tax=Pokkaliibacter plantistimulans TaxID=1635171 RepID=UPI002D77B19E|nr:lysozyme inhibitor LprI family protein [Pokkaliibacter plantistimulans]